MSSVPQDRPLPRKRFQLEPTGGIRQGIGEPVRTSARPPIRKPIRKISRMTNSSGQRLSFSWKEWTALIGFAVAAIAAPTGNMMSMESRVEARLAVLEAHAEAQTDILKKMDLVTRLDEKVQYLQTRLDRIEDRVRGE